MNNIKIAALGGLDENGKSMYCIEIGYKLFIVNCGIKRAEVAQFGVDYVIPDFTYVIDNKERVAAIIITHMHDDMMEALPYLIKQVNLPVYATKGCQIFIREQFKKHNIKDYRLYDLPRNGETTIDGTIVRTFSLTHSTPDAIGVAIDSPSGQIVVAEQFVVDFDVKDESFKSDVSALADISKKGVFCAMLEASYAERVGFTAPKHRVTNILKPVFEDASGRIIVTVYGQNYLRIRELISLATATKRKIYFLDEQLKENITLFEQNNFYHLPKNTLITKEQFDNSMENIVIFVTDYGAKIFEKMQKIALKEDDTISLRDSDTVIIASPVVSGTEKMASVMENELYKEDVNIFKLDSKTTLSMHPSQEDIKMFLSILKPRYYIPVMGSYFNFVNAANLAIDNGITPDRIIILDNGQAALFNDGKLITCSTKIEPIGDILINDSEKENITSQVLRDRELLSTDGVIILGITIDFKTKKVFAGPDVQSRGLIYVKDSEYLITNVGNLVVQIINEKAATGNWNNQEARAEIREQVSKYVLRETGKRPMILSAIVEINI